MSSKVKNSYVERGLNPDVPLAPERKNVVTVRPTTASEMAKPKHEIRVTKNPLYFLREDDSVIVLQSEPQGRDFGNLGAAARFIIELTEPVMSRGKMWEAGTKFEVGPVDKDNFILTGKAKLLYEVRKG